MTTALLGEPDRGLMDAPVFLATLQRLGPHTVAERLASHLTEARRARIDAVLRARLDIADARVAARPGAERHTWARSVGAIEARLRRTRGGVDYS